MILIYPRYVIEDNLKRNKPLLEKYPIISISDIGNKLKDVSSLNILQLEFYDDSSFTLEHAQQIKEFVDANIKAQHFIIHCDAGISRSGAVGTWVNYYLGCDEKIFHEKNPNIHPNKSVFRKLNEWANTNFKIKSEFDIEMEEKGWF